MATKTTSKLSVDFSVHADGKVVRVASIPLTSDDKENQKLAMRWRYALGQRHRWSTDEQLSVVMQSMAVEACNQWGLRQVDLEKLAQKVKVDANHDPTGLLSTLIEVSIPYTSESEHWWARVMPWEYVISAATKEYRAGAKKCIVRRLVLNRGDQHISRANEPTSFAVLEAAPGSFRDVYDFTDEHAMIRGALPLTRLDLHRECSTAPDLGSVSRWLQQNQPSILHVTGVDARLGNRLLKLSQTSKDGVYLAGKRKKMELIDSERLAKAFFGSAATPLYSPDLVAFNLWHSGARMAPLAVAHGAQAALGFENTFDDAVAERFFAQFYRQYAAGNWNLGHAFLEAFQSIAALSEVTRGSGIILWTRESLLAHVSMEPRGAVDRSVVADPAKHRARDLIRVDVAPLGRLNYADLHNRGTLFEKFNLAMYGSGPDSVSTQVDPDVNTIQDLDIEVQLLAAGEVFPYKTSLDLVPSENIVDLANNALAATENHGPGGIYVPLTSTLMRSIDESLLTSLHVSVKWHSQVVYNRTFPVHLAPVDEWRFDDDQIIWMPSFVYPRDPAVSKIIDSAQRYLGCLADDYSAGFGGYQAYDPKADDPWKGVEAQVQAIWTALSLDFGLDYINPPPSYSENAQRLRTPSRILKEGRGTCVDLALLMAACLEWVEIYPVIFNLHDHAFPGYWRNLHDYELFQQTSMRSQEFESKLSEDDLNNSQGKQLASWYSPQSAYSEIRSYVLPTPRSLVPMETVMLTQRSGFQAAIKEATVYFEKSRSKEFHSMIDVARSRTRVTPIPLGVPHWPDGASES
ncbi:MAG: hypothetical protein JNL67_16150 [Planctomycetaceae bacterium]|nr:hypothetical protein [Planctomycetaceae bacterium]